jgi:hypothetical protein
MLDAVSASVAPENHPPSRLFYDTHMLIFKHNIKLITTIIFTALLFLLAAFFATHALETPTRAATQLRPRSAANHVPHTTKGQSAWIIEQNLLRGSNAWKIDGPVAGDKLEGFLNTTYSANRQNITFYISTIANEYRIRAFRMGYYQGKGARLIWVSRLLKGHAQPACTIKKQVNMVSCDNWKQSYRLWLSKAFVQGDYLFELVAKNNLKSYIPLTIWDPTSHATYIIKNDVLTWQAWNSYGGYDFYAGIGNCSGGYPLCSRARVVSFDRPYDYGNGAGDFLINEYPLVYFAEEHGLNVTYITDITLIQHPQLLRYHKALLSLGHDECWSYTERVSVENAAKLHGLNVAFFGASAMLRHVRIQSSPMGNGREEVDYRDSSADPMDDNGRPEYPMLVTGNTWSSPPADWSEDNFVGEEYVGFVQSDEPAQPVIIKNADSFLFRGVTYDGKAIFAGEKIPGIIASDFDSADPYLDIPSLKIATESPIGQNVAFFQSGNASNGFAYSEMSYHFEKPSGTLIFDSGTNNWIQSLTPCPHTAKFCPAEFSQKVTLNLLLRMSQ